MPGKAGMQVVTAVTPFGLPATSIGSPVGYCWLREGLLIACGIFYLLVGGRSFSAARSRRTILAIAA